MIREALKSGVCVLLVAQSACAEQSGETAPDKSAPETPQHSMPGADDSTSVNGEALSLQVATAVTDLAEKLDIDEDFVAVKEARFVNWGSSAVGCPRPGMRYMQAIVPGVLLLLEARGRIFRYHGEGDSTPFYCPDERAEAPAYGQGKQFM